MKRFWDDVKYGVISGVAMVLTILYLRLADHFLTGPINSFFHLKLSSFQAKMIYSAILLIVLAEIGFHLFSGIFFWLVGYIRYLTKYILLMKEEGIGFSIHKMSRNPYSFDKEIKEIKNIHDYFHGMRISSVEDDNYLIDSLLFKPTFFEWLGSLFKKEKKPPK